MDGLPGHRHRKVRKSKQLNMSDREASIYLPAGV